MQECKTLIKRYFYEDVVYSIWILEEIALDFNVCIAGVNIGIRTKNLEIYQYLSDFVTEKESDEKIEVFEEELVKIHDSYPDFSRIMCEKAALKYKIDKLLANYNTFSIHASSLGFRGEGYVFTALSGVGKSTFSRSWCNCFKDEVVMINDDRPYLKVTEDRVYAYSYPQSGEYGIYNNVSFPVRVIGKIIRDKENYVKELSRDAFFPFIVQQSFTMDDINTTKTILSLIKKCIKNVTLLEIHCNENVDSAKDISYKIDMLLHKG